MSALLAATPGGADEAVHEGNWLSWRGPLQTGVSVERYEGGTFNPEPVWTYDMEGRSCPVIHDGRLYSWGYRGAGPDLQEVLSSLNPDTGEVYWERTSSDFISDTVYSRYSLGAPAVDPETGNVYLHTTYGLLNCHDRDGNLLWEISMMERFGRLTFPNGRAGSPVVDGDLLITRAVTSYWGADGPARDRFFAFDKKTGELVWASSPGVGAPFLKDTSFSTPYFTTRAGRRVFYVGLGCGNLACLSTEDGKPLWRSQQTVGGINSSPVIYEDLVIAIHGTENMDSTEMGRMFALKLPADDSQIAAEVDPEQGGAPHVTEKIEAWRYAISAFTSSPCLVEDRVYQVTDQGELYCFEAGTGKVLWEEKLDTGNVHSSPVYVDGLLIVPMNMNKLFVLKPGDTGVEVLHQIAVEGNCLNGVAVCNGMVYVQTTEKLYAFKIENEGIGFDPLPAEAEVVKGEAVSMRAIPADVLLEPGDKVTFRFEALDANGNVVAQEEPIEATWETFVPPTARVKAQMDASFDGSGALVAEPGAEDSAGMFKGTGAGLTGFVRGRVMEALPIREDFEGYELTAEHPIDGTKYAFPPLPWIGARLKWDIRELEGNKVLSKTLDDILFQRGMSFVGHPDSSNYTIQADVMTDGNRRIKSTVGLVNQRYIAALVGNANLLEINSNYERVAESVPFPVAANTWYTLKMRVDVHDDGSGTIRAKAWLRDEAEPEAWTLEVEHKNAHKKGAPGLYGFAPQSQKSVYVDNLQILPNE